MGSTGYYDSPTRDEALARELGPGYEVLKKSGAWVLVTKTATNEATPPVYLIHVIFQRSSSMSTIKLVEAGMGPYAFPSKAMLNEYLRLRVHEPGQTEDEWVAAAFEHYAKRERQPKISTGSTVTLDGGDTARWSDGEAITGDYTYLGKFRATRYDGATVRLPKDWRARYLVGGAA